MIHFFNIFYTITKYLVPLRAIFFIAVVFTFPIAKILGQDNVAEVKNRPNVVLIFTDQQHANMLSAAGNPYVKTPAMDELAANGVMFSESYCTSPVCGPARSSIITGLMPHQTGVEWNGQSIKDNVVNSGELFRSAGYQTVWAGKWHLPESYPQQSSVRNKEIKGFDLLPFWNPEEKRWFLGSETDPPLTTAVVDYLKAYKKEKPLFLSVSYHNPHDICFYPRKDGWVSPQDSLLEIRHYGFKHKLPDVIGTHPMSISPLPPLPHNHAISKDEPDFISEKRKNHDEYGVETKLANREFDDMAWKGYLNAYHRLTERVDIEIGKVLEALKTYGYWENTLIIFTSDHGDGAAAHKWAAKLSFYEEAAKVPMIVFWPGMEEKGLIDKDHAVSQIDILPTMLDYAGIETSVRFTGRSMKPLIENRTSKWRDYTVVELADFVKDKTRKGRMVRMGAFKYNIYSTGEEQLFNIGRDSGELQNLISEPTLQHIRQQCRKNLKKWAKETNDAFAIDVLG
ncbi:sulfatase [Spongiimicrobium sp. 3-5]|uniref:sulfatase family protein n=1 Tax=Spongiimicrobium sp. 3-5 TaxID=3332596 RepID=UPI00397FCA7B